VISAHTSSAEETRALAASLAGLLRAGDVLLLGGDLGAGKTTFTQGLGRALGVTDQITSPTFTLVREYDAAAGSPRLLHVDVYRLEAADIFDLGLAELIDSDTVAVVEWGDRAAPVLGPDHLEVDLALGADTDARVLRFHPSGPGWAARAQLLADALGPWREAA
jgi:tRNA threonylcarbamoyladenosine biosynthesis protein TsaE